MLGTRVLWPRTRGSSCKLKRALNRVCRSSVFAAKSERVKSAGKRKLLHFWLQSTGLVSFRAGTLCIYCIHYSRTDTVRVLLRIAWQCGRRVLFFCETTRPRAQKRNDKRVRWTFFDISRYNAIVSHATWPFVLFLVIAGVFLIGVRLIAK